MNTYTSRSLEETREIASQWLNNLANTEKEATVVGLSGHLGAGKTAFVKLVAKLLGVKEEVTSPTFVIMKIYDLNPDFRLSTFDFRLSWHRLVHIDAYRLEKPEELEVLNLEQLIADPHNLIMVEWPENVELEKVVPEFLKIQFEIVDGEYRITW